MAAPIRRWRCPGAGRPIRSERSVPSSRRRGRGPRTRDRERQAGSRRADDSSPSFVTGSAAALQVGQDLAGCVLAGLAGDAAAGVRAGAEQVQALDWKPVPAAPEEWPPQEPLVERLFAMERMAPTQPVLTLEVEGRDHLAGADAAGKARRREDPAVEQLLVVACRG